MVFIITSLSVNIKEWEERIFPLLNGRREEGRKPKSEEGSDKRPSPKLAERLLAARELTFNCLGCRNLELSPGNTAADRVQTFLLGESVLHTPDRSGFLDL